ncbi:MAG: PspC domain-containing protein [Candidatus Moranbacteria bacterium]|nr:PspC domain-containing protein [Candidatus Moranbacteria bacterium]
MDRDLKRVVGDGKNFLGGVCAGAAYCFGVPAWILRVTLVLAVCLYGFGVMLYLVLWMFMPQWETVPDDYDAVTQSQ